MPCFSRTRSASASGPCVACCKAEHAADGRLSQAVADRVEVLAARSATIASRTSATAPASAYGAPARSGAATCAQRAAALEPVRQRFDRYRDALPSARAAADLSELGDEAGDVPTKKPCLTRLPQNAAKLNAAMGLPPGQLADGDLRNDATGFRAAMYRDEESGRLILVPRDTQPDSLADWQTNTRNGMGQDTLQYAAMRRLTLKLTASDQSFDLAGYSKGGGMAQEGGLMSALSQVRVFNSAGLSEGALSWTRQPDFASLSARTRAFSAEGDFLTFMNDTTDPGQSILNARFLQRELAGQGVGLNPIDIKVRNPGTRGVTDPTFAGDKSSYIDELGDHIDDMQTAYDTGAAVAGFPPVRAGFKETVVDSMTSAGALFNARSDRPTLGKLAQHKMSAVLDAMESDVQADRKALQQFLVACG